MGLLFVATYETCLWYTTAGQVDKASLDVGLAAKVITVLAARVLSDAAAPFPAACFGL